jgi:transketolase
MTSEQLAWKIRRHGIEMTHVSHGAHIASVLSVADIVAVLYNEVVNVDPKNPDKQDRDRVILSKGHAGAAIYAVLAEKGFFDVKELLKHCANGSNLSGHVSSKGVPGVELSTGSLGHGLSVGAGMAYAAKKDDMKYNVFVICGDGECDEGAIWEAALVSNHFRLNNLILIVDHNRMQSLDFCEKTIELEPFSNKWAAFGWNVIVINGHDHSALREAFANAKMSDLKPTVIIANTIKGKGISFMENNIAWHYKYPDGAEYDEALKELHEQMPAGISDMYQKGEQEL